MDDLSNIARQIKAQREQLIPEALRDIQKNYRLIDGITERINPFHEIKQVVSDLQRMSIPCENIFKQILNDFSRFKERSKKFEALLHEVKWPPPGHLSSTFIDKIVKSFESGELSKDEIENLFVKGYSPSVLAEIRGAWLSYSWLGERLTILSESLDNYKDARYYSVVYCLVPQIEGLFGSELGRTPKPEKDANLVFEGSPHGELIAKYYKLVILENFEAWNLNAPVPSLSRHAIVHGRATGSGTQVHALKVIIFLDYLLGAFAKRRSGPAAK